MRDKVINAPVSGTGSSLYRSGAVAKCDQGSILRHIPKAEPMQQGQGKKKLKTSVTVVNKTTEATAGSAPARSKPSGIRIPANPATKRLTIIASAMTPPSCGSPNQNQAMPSIITANTIPLTHPTNTSLPTMRIALLAVSSFVANARTAMVNVCVPAFPPIDATIGIRIANATTCSMAWSKNAITIDARIAVAKLTSSHENRDSVVSITAL